MNKHKSSRKGKEAQSRHPVKVLALFGSFLLFSLILLISFSSAQTVAQGQCAKILVTPNATGVAWINISTLSYPNNDTIVVLNARMTNLTTATFNYSVCDTFNLGELRLDGFDSQGGTYQFFVNVTPSGNPSNIWYFVFITVLFYFVALYGFSKNIGVMAVLGGLGMMSLGIYFVNGGLDVYRDVITLTISYITLALGSYIAMTVAVDTIVEEYNKLA